MQLYARRLGSKRDVLINPRSKLNEKLRKAELQKFGIITRQSIRISPNFETRKTSVLQTLIKYLETAQKLRIQKCRNEVCTILRQMGYLLTGNSS